MEDMRARANATALTLLAAVGVLTLPGCGTTSKSLRLIVSVTSSPTASLARLRCLKEAVRETKTPANFEIFTNRTPCSLTLVRKGYEQMEVDVTADMLVARIIPPNSEKKAPEPTVATGEGAVNALLSLLHHSVELLVGAGNQTSMTGLKPDVRLHYVLKRPAPTGAIAADDNLSKRASSNPATTVSPATNPHQSPTIPIPIENPSSRATGKPTIQ